MDDMDTKVLSGVWDRLEGFLRVSPAKEMLRRGSLCGVGYWITEELRDKVVTEMGGKDGMDGRGGGRGVRVKKTDTLKLIE